MIGVVAAVLFGAGLSRSAGLRGGLGAVAAGALGIGAESVVYAASLLAIGPRAVVWGEAALGAVGVALLGLRRSPLRERAPADPPPLGLVALFVAACAICAAAFIEHTWRLPDGGWDAWMIWNLRARFLYRGGDGFAAAFSPAMVYLVHQDYPFLVPGLVAQGFEIAGGESAAVPAAVAAAFAVLLVAGVVATSHVLLGTKRSLLAGLAVVTLPAFPTFASNQQSDVPLALYLLLAIALIELDLPALAGFAAGLCAWTKNEGMMYAALLAFCLAWRGGKLRSTARFAAGAAPVLALVILYKALVVPPTDLAALSTHRSLLHNLLDPARWLELFGLIARRLVFFQSFALWLVAETGTLVLLRRHRPGPIGAALLSSCACFLLIYVLQPFGLQWIFRTSVDRLVMQLWPAAVLATALALPRERTKAHT